MSIFRTLANGLSGKTGHFNRLFSEPCEAQVRALAALAPPDSLRAENERLLHAVVRKCLWAGVALCYQIYFDEGNRKALCTTQEMQSLGPASAVGLLYPAQLVLVKTSLSGESEMAHALSRHLCVTLPAADRAAALGLVRALEEYPPVELLKETLRQLHPRLKDDLMADVWLDIYPLFIASGLNQAIAALQVPA